MNPRDDHEWALSSADPDIQFRRLTIVQAISELAMARAHEIDEAQIRVYTLALLELDLELVVQACGELAKQPRREGQTALPAVGDIIARCYKIREDEKKAAEERAFAEAYQRADVMPMARREALNDWLKRSIQAGTHGHRTPDPPFKLSDSLDATYRCHGCRDTGWMRECQCGRPGCRACFYGRMKRCGCQPQPMPVERPESKTPRRRGQSWNRAGESG